MAITISMSGREIDKTLKMLYEAQDEKNDGKVLYIRKGELAFENPESLFDVTELE